MEKIQLVLVDDELSSRNTIKKYLEENDIYEIIADFKNGKTALDWLRKNSVDILLCDMQMPEMNGVELMRNVHIINEYLPVIAISGFDDFNFVRGSLVNGAANYLLKHELTKEYLLHVLDQVREQYRIVPKGKKVYRKRGFCIREEISFQADYIRKLTEENKIEFCCSNVCCIAISPDYKIRKDIHPLEYKQDISKAVIDIISQILGENYPYIIYITKEYHLYILISFEKEKSMLLMMNSISNIAARLQRLAIRMLDTTLSVVCGEVHANLDGAMQEINKIRILLHDKFYLGENRIVYTTVTNPVVYSGQILEDTCWEQLEFEFANHMPAYIDTIGEMLDIMERGQVYKKYAHQCCVQIIQLMKKYGYLEESDTDQQFQKMDQFEVFGQYRSLILEILHRQTQDLRQQERKQYSVNITKALIYIQENYTADISLEKCAEIVGCSYTSLSKEFKKETGLRFVEYLNQQRVNKAKSLLIRNDISMKEIVEQSGFRNYNYFFKVFKEMVGMTPSAFAAKK